MSKCFQTTSYIYLSIYSLILYSPIYLFKHCSFLGKHHIIEVEVEGSHLKTGEVGESFQNLNHQIIYKVMNG